MTNEQQNFWKNTYAEEYRSKNAKFDHGLALEAWSLMTKKCTGVDSILECGSNIGRNIAFLNDVIPTAKKSVIELSPEAYDIVTSRYSLESSFNGPIVECDFADNSFDLTFTMGVMIHIHPDDLLANMKKVYDLSAKYILIGESFNRTPVMIEYKGEKNKLFKSDFGKTFIENFDVDLVDYGFLWGHIYDPAGFDDVTWWVFEKIS